MRVDRGIFFTMLLDDVDIGLCERCNKKIAFCNKRASELPRQVNDRVDAIIKTEWTRTAVSDTLTDTSIDMVETTAPTQAADGQTQFGNARHLDPSDCIFVFKNTLSDYEEPPSDEEVERESRTLGFDNVTSVFFPSVEDWKRLETNGDYIGVFPTE
ncbi:uncharacterized protein LOC105258729 [Camponotus floridanus]|uniref:uncharacterized protein LOC105258729 n=1 Tax=Camponotus floridanus TaxID=104421 RepID=UPI000DC6687E|nr:uncharacterized protein LOC105258729 [Camponotus floridanus]